MVRFATIGTNFITKWFLEAVKCCDGLEYIAAYSRSEEIAEAFANEHGAKRYYTNLGQMAVSDDIDAVYIASPNSLHSEQAIQMMQHGKHVLCEKTIASNSRELKHMLEIAERNHVVLLEAMRPAFTPGFLAIKENLHKLGIIRRASFQYCQYSSRYDKYKAGIIENAFNPAFSNGALMDIGVYCVHPLVRLFGMPDSIHADAILLENGVDGAGTILARYKDMQAELIYSKISGGRVPSQIQGENASMLIKEIQDTREIIICYHNGAMEEIRIEEEGTTMKYEIKEWVHLIENQLMAREHNQYSVMGLKIMDEARRQLGIVFPADHYEI